jgi:peptide/nickel transport system substrate-binding protein
MKRFDLLLLAASSISIVCSVGALAATRPHYGGTLHISVREMPHSLEPATLVQAGCSNVAGLIFDTLVTLDERGHPQPSLATTWQMDPGDQRLRLSLRGDISFSDGSPLNATVVAASLRASNPEWKIIATGDAVVIETAVPNAELASELALPRNAIASHAGQQFVGTGPFAIFQWLPGKHLSLSANDHYWAGRPFVDSVELDFGKNAREQLTELDLGRSDIVEMTAENIRRARSEGLTVATSNPSELLALQFSGPPRSEEDAHIRNALALSLDTSAINNVVLQGGGEPSESLLPNWLSGYAFLFSKNKSVAVARQERAQAKQSAPLLLRYDALDPVSHTIAERILLNGRDAGVALQLTTTAPSDLVLVRVPIGSSDPRTALNEVAKALQLPAPRFTSNTVTGLYAAEKALLQTHTVIPLLHLRTGAAIRSNVQDFNVLSDGEWQIQNIWLSPEKP